MRSCLLQIGFDYLTCPEATFDLIWRSLLCQCFGHQSAGWLTRENAKRFLCKHPSHRPPFTSRNTIEKGFVDANATAFGNPPGLASVPAPRASRQHIEGCTRLAACGLCQANGCVRKPRSQCANASGRGPRSLKPAGMVSREELRKDIRCAQASRDCQVA